MIPYFSCNFDVFVLRIGPWRGEGLIGGFPPIGFPKTYYGQYHFLGGDSPENYLKKWGLVDQNLTNFEVPES